MRLPKAKGGPVMSRAVLQNSTVFLIYHIALVSRLHTHTQEPRIEATVNLLIKISCRKT